MISIRSIHPNILESGNGSTTLVFLHYFGGSADTWRWVMDLLPDYRCIAFHLPGLGGTSIDQNPSVEYYTILYCKHIGHLYPLENPEWLADTLRKIL